MPNRCSICHSESRATIDKALEAGASARGTAIRLGLSIHALQVHKRDHHDPPAGSTPSRNRPSGSGIAELVLLLEQEVASSTGRARLEASREYRLAMGELAKSGGTGGPTPLADIEGYKVFRTILLRALAPYSEARQAVADAIRAWEAS